MLPIDAAIPSSTRVSAKVIDGIANRCRCDGSTRPRRGGRCDRGATTHLQRRGDRRGVLDAGYVPPDDEPRQHGKPHTGAEGRLNRCVAWTARHQ